MMQLTPLDGGGGLKKKKPKKKDQLVRFPSVGKPGYKGPIADMPIVKEARAKQKPLSKGPANQGFPMIKPYQVQPLSAPTGLAPGWGAGVQPQGPPAPPPGVNNPAINPQTGQKADGTGYIPGTAPQVSRGAQADVAIAQNRLAGATRDANQLQAGNQKALSRLDATIQAGDPGATAQNYQAFKSGTGGDANQYKALYGDRANFGGYLQGQGVSQGQINMARQLGSGGNPNGANIDTFAPQDNTPLEQQNTRSAQDILDRQMTDEEALANYTPGTRKDNPEVQARLAKGEAYKEQRLQQEMDRRLSQQEERNQRKADRSKDRTTKQDIGTHSNQRYQDDREGEKLNEATDRQHGLLDNQQAHEKEIAALSRGAQEGDPNALSDLTKLREQKFEALTGRRSELESRLDGLETNPLDGTIVDTEKRDALEKEIDQVEAQIEIQGKLQDRDEYRYMINSGTVNRQDIETAKMFANDIQYAAEDGHTAKGYHDDWVEKLTGWGYEFPPLAAGQERYTPEQITEGYKHVLDAKYRKRGFADFLMTK